MSFIIKIISTNCTGCRICQLWCSYSHFKVFSLEKGFIEISNPYNLQPQISFKEGCDNCGQCAHHCLYNALIIMEGPE